MPKIEFDSMIHPEGFQIYAPMKINTQPSLTDLQAMINSHQYLISEKIDGAWFQLIKTNKDRIHLFSRTISKKDGQYVDRIENVPHIKQWAQLLPRDTTLIGEIYVQGGKSNNVTSIMGCLPQTAIARQNSNQYGGPVHYYVHDCICYNGQNLLDTPLHVRISHYLYYMLGDLFDHEHYVHLAQYYQNQYDGRFAELPYRDFNEYINEVFAKGGEGVVLKDSDGLYEPGKRPMTNRKVKEHKDNIDLVIMECLDPEKFYNGKYDSTWPYWEDGIPVTKPYYYGWKNAVRVGAYKNGQLIEVGRVASGFTDAEREAMGKTPDAFIGQVIECSCMSVNKDDLTLRHPVFVRFRPDKDAKDCKISEIFT